MKKSLLVIAILVISCGATLARTLYSSSGKIIYDDTLRGRKNAANQQYSSQNKRQAAAAAKINYEEEMKKLEKTGLRPHFSDEEN